MCDSSVRIRKLVINNVQASGTFTGWFDNKRIGIRQSKTTLVNDAHGGTDLETLHCDSPDFNESRATCQGMDWDRFDERKGILYDGTCSERLKLARLEENLEKSAFESICSRWKVGHDFVNFCADGWILPIVSHANYYLKFDWHVDWRQMTIQWSEKYWLETHTTSDAESSLLRFPYYGYRYRYNTQGANEERMLSWLPGTVAGDRYVGEDGSSTGVTRLSKWGTSQIFQQDDRLDTNFPAGGGEVRIAINPIDALGLAPENSLSALRVNCNPLQCKSMCEAPADTPLSPPMKWSRSTTWQAVRLASFSGDPSEGVSSLKFNYSMTWQKQARSGLASLPPDGVHLEIPAGVHIRLDTSTARLKVLVVVGHLDFDVTATNDIDLAVEQLIVFGSLHVGTEDFPWLVCFLRRICACVSTSVVHGYQATYLPVNNTPVCGNRRDTRCSCGFWLMNGTPCRLQAVQFHRIHHCAGRASHLS